MYFVILAEVDFLYNELPLENSVKFIDILLGFIKRLLKDY